MHWEVKELPKPPSGKTHGPLSQWVDVHDKDNDEVEPVPQAETKTLCFYPNIPGCVQLRRRWYMTRRERPMVPAPSNTPMPDKQGNAEAKSRLYSLYLRPWTLDKAIATSEVPHITDLDDLSNCHPCVGCTPTGTSGGGTFDPPDKAEAAFPRRRLRSKQKADVEETTSKRSYATAWSWYVRGHIVTEHAAKIIKQFMAACCGKQLKMRNAQTTMETAWENPERCLTIPCR